jgi:chitodextrinase
MWGAAPRNCRRYAYLVAAALSVVATPVGTSATVAHRSLPAQIWGWELDAAGATAADSASLVNLRRHGINTIVLDGTRIRAAQVARIRRLASGTGLSVFVAARSTSGVKTLAARKDANVVVVRLARPGMVRTVSDSASTRVLVLAPLTMTGRPFATAAWRAAIQTAVDDPKVDLAVGHAPAAWKRAAQAFFHVLAARPTRDLKAPSAPAGFAAVSTGSSIALSWRASRDNRRVRGYRVALGKRVTSVKDPKASFGALACGTANAFEVRALDVAGNLSSASRYTASTLACAGSETDVLPPSAPLGVVVQTAAQSSVTLTWPAATDNVAVAGYSLYNGDTRVGTSTTLSYAYTGLACGTSYALAVDAFDTAGNRSARSPVTATTAACVSGGDTTPPTTPASLRTTSVAATAVSLAWGASTDNVGVTGYRARLNGVVVDSTTALSFSFAGLACATGYTFSVSAYDAQGNESPTAALSVASAACPLDTTPPSTPGNLTKASATATTISVSWSASTDNVAVTAYTAYKNGVASGTTSTSPYSYSGLTCATSYVLEIAAVDASGNSSPKASITVTTATCTGDTTPPSTPGNLAKASATATAVTISWSASTDNVAVTSYSAYKNGAGAGTSSSSPYSYSGLTCATSYVLAVAAVDAAGNISPKASITVATAACPDTTAPSTPAGLAVGSISQTAIALSWTASTDNVGVTGYGAYKNTALAGSSSSAGYTFSGLTCGTTYTLGADAYDAAANRSARASITAATSACAADTAAPSAPASLTTSGVSQSSITLTWAASTDNVGVAGYGAYKNTALQGSSASTSYTFSGLACGTSYTFGVDAYDAVGNRSAATSLGASTAACGGATVANLWMSTQGGLCARSATPVAFNQSTSCNSVQAAYNACQPGDLIGVQAGSYGGQNVSGTKASPGCIFDMGITGTQATFSDLTPLASWLEFRNGNIPGGYAWNSPPAAPSHLTLRNIDTRSNALMKGGSDIAIIGGSVHNWDAGNHAAVFWFETENSSQTMPNITVQGVTFHDLTNSVSGNHMEIIRIDTGTSNVLIDGNRFYNNQESTSTIFITNVNTDPGDPHDITIQNNMFGNVPNAYYVIATQTPVIQTCKNIAVRYNSFATSPTTMSGCTSKVNTTIIGNVGPRGSGCESGATYGYNVWQYSSSSKCGSTDKMVVGGSDTNLLGFANESTGDMHISASSPAIAAGDPANHPALDYDGQSRPTGTDAGADER